MHQRVGSRLVGVFAAGTLLAGSLMAIAGNVPSAAGKSPGTPAGGPVHKAGQADANTVSEVDVSALPDAPATVIAHGARPALRMDGSSSTPEGSAGGAKSAAGV